MGEDTWGLAVDTASVWVQVSESDIWTDRPGHERRHATRIHEVPAMQFEDGTLWALDIGTGIVRWIPSAA